MQNDLATDKCDPVTNYGDTNMRNMLKDEKMDFRESPIQRDEVHVHRKNVEMDKNEIQYIYLYQNHEI